MLFIRVYVGNNEYPQAVACLETQMTVRTVSRPAGRSLQAFLWIAQVLVAAVFVMSGVMKLFTPIVQLSADIPWTGQLPLHFVRFIGLVDLAGGVGLLLPALTRIAPRLTPLAAFGASVLQALAIAFHCYRGEFAVLPLNFVLLPLALFILWGRTTRAPIAPRAAARAP